MGHLPLETGCREAFYWNRWAPSLRDSGGIVGLTFPTLKRGANKHCAYGAGDGLLANYGVGSKGFFATLGAGLAC
jgi:hypothetical protein